jgi:hypothetical protein
MKKFLLAELVARYAGDKLTNLINSNLLLYNNILITALNSINSRFFSVGWCWVIEGWATSYAPPPVRRLRLRRYLSRRL